MILSNIDLGHDRSSVRRAADGANISTFTKVHAATAKESVVRPPLILLFPAVNHYCYIIVTYCTISCIVLRWTATRTGVGNKIIKRKYNIRGAIQTVIAFYASAMCLKSVTFQLFKTNSVYQNCYGFDVNAIRTGGNINKYRQSQNNWRNFFFYMRHCLYIVASDKTAKYYWEILHGRLNLTDKTEHLITQK